MNCDARARELPLRRGRRRDRRRRTGRAARRRAARARARLAARTAADELARGPRAGGARAGVYRPSHRCLPDCGRAAVRERHPCGSRSAPPARRRRARRAHVARTSRREVREPERAARARRRPRRSTGSLWWTTTCGCRGASSTASSPSASVRARPGPARQTLTSHAAWNVTRRRGATSCARPASWRSAPSRPSGRAAAELLPFPELRWGWGLDLHWGAGGGARLAARRGGRAAGAPRAAVAAAYRARGRDGGGGAGSSPAARSSRSAVGRS